MGKRKVMIFLFKAWEDNMLIYYCLITPLPHLNGIQQLKKNLHGCCHIINEQHIKGIFFLLDNIWGLCWGDINVMGTCYGWCTLFQYEVFTYMSGQNTTWPLRAWVLVAVFHYELMLATRAHVLYTRAKVIGSIFKNDWSSETSGIPTNLEPWFKLPPKVWGLWVPLAGIRG